MFQRFLLAAVFLRSYGNAISDVNYDEATLPLAIGTPAQITGYELSASTRWPSTPKARSTT